MQRQLPREQLLERRDRGADGTTELNVPSTRDPGRTHVVATGLGADDGVDRSRRARASQIRPNSVDHEVVADVVPAADEAVELVDREQHRRHGAGGVAVRVVGVVDKSELTFP